MSEVVRVQTGGKKRGSKRTMNERRYALLPGRWREIADGTFDLEELSDEEVFQGRLRTANGSLGPKPPLLPQNFIEEQTRRSLSWASQRIRDMSHDGLKTLHELMVNPNVDANTRRQCAVYIIDKFVGKEAIQVKVSVEDPIESLFMRLLENPNGLAPAPVEPSKSELT